jgi:peptidylprolyl isomerase
MPESPVPVWRHPAVLALAITAAVLVTAVLFSGGDSGKDTLGSSSTPTASPTPSPTPVVTGCPAGPATTDLKKKPAPVLPAGTTSPAETTFTDVVVGKGKEAKAGSAVSVKYVGVLFDSCREFDSSWSRGASETLPFTIGSGVIPGFSTGATGMRVGGRRQVVIPSAEGYGPEGGGPIPPNATLIFLIDLVSVR